MLHLLACFKNTSSMRDCYGFFYGKTLYIVFHFRINLKVNLWTFYSMLPLKPLNQRSSLHMVNTLSKPAPPLCHCSVNTLQSPTSDPCQARGPKGTAFIWAIVKPERGGIDSYLHSISICGIHVAGGQHFALIVYCDPHSSSACWHPYTQKQADKNSSQKKKIIIFGGGLW